MGANGEHSSRLRNFEGLKLVTNLKETKEAKCKLFFFDFRVDQFEDLWTKVHRKGAEFSEMFILSSMGKEFVPSPL